MKEHNYRYDLLRIVACVMIICMHAPLPGEGTNGLFLSALSYFTAPALCIFFVLSGALLLGKKQRTLPGPPSSDAFAFLKKRLGKVVGPTLSFTVLYWVIDWVNGVDFSLIRRICSVPFSNQGHGVLWFMYTLVGLYLLTPILNRWLMAASKREVELYLGIWAVTLCYPLLSMVVEINTSDTGMLYYFSGYAGYFVLGYYLKTYPDVITWRRLALPLIFSIIAPIVCKLGGIQVDFYSVFWYLSIFVATLTVALYKLFMIGRIELAEGGSVARWVRVTSGLTFGIYLLHIAIMRQGLWKWDFILGIQNYYLQWAVIVALTFVLSWVACYLISLTPVGKWVVGYGGKK